MFGKLALGVQESPLQETGLLQQIRSKRYLINEYVFELSKL
jgi:hypothetical protein